MQLLWVDANIDEARPDSRNTLQNLRSVANDLNLIITAEEGSKSKIYPNQLEPSIMYTTVQEPPPQHETGQKLRWNEETGRV